MIGFFAFILGASIGSFIAARVMRIRLHLDQSPMGRSECMSCHHSLSALELIPLVSYLFLQGRCHACKKTFSAFYFIVELVTALLFVLVTLQFSFEPTALFLLKLVAVWGLVSMLWYISLVDYYLKAFPVGGLTVGTGIFLCSSFLFKFPVVGLDSLWGIVFFAGVLFLTMIVGKLYFKKDAMGEGDLYLAAFIGSALGLAGSVVAFYAAVLSGALFSIYFLVSKRPIEYLPFAPFLSFGALVSYFFGAEIMGWYLGMFL